MRRYSLRANESNRATVPTSCGRRGSADCSATAVKIVIFGLTLSSSWGNGHATLWRGLIGALSSSGHDVVFFEKDVPYYATHRDLTSFPGAQLVLYNDWSTVSSVAKHHVVDADATIVTSYCPDANTASHL